MDEGGWERAVETAVDGQTNVASARSLTLDGAVKCVQGHLPPPSLLEKFQGLEQLSIANVGVSSLEKFPRLPNLQKLILSDNRISGGLEFLVEAGLDSLRDLDLSNNRIQYLEDLVPLAQLKLVSLDLYECPVTRIKDYRSRVFGLIKSLKYLDKMDVDENERPESDDEEEDDEEDEEEDDPGSGEIYGEDRSGKVINGASAGGDDILDVDEDEESDAEDEETETSKLPNGSNRELQNHSNGFQAALDGEEEEDVEDEEDNDLGEEIDEEEDVVEVHEIMDSDDDEDGVEVDDDEEDEEEVEDEEDDAVPLSVGRHLMSAEGEIDGHEHGEEDENGEIGEEEDQDVEEVGEYDEDDGDDEEEDCSADYLVRPVVPSQEDAGGIHKIQTTLYLDCTELVTSVKKLLVVLTCTLIPLNRLKIYDIKVESDKWGVLQTVTHLMAGLMDNLALFTVHYQCQKHGLSGAV